MRSSKNREIPAVHISTVRYSCVQYTATGPKNNADLALSYNYNELAANKIGML